MIKSERMIKKYGPHFPWSPILTTAIQDLSIWKLIKSKLKTETSRTSKLQQLTSPLHKIDNKYPKHISTYERQNIKLINKNISTSNNKLKEIK